MVWLPTLRVLVEKVAKTWLPVDFPWKTASPLAAALSVRP